MYEVYILKGVNWNRYYIGFTENLKQRLINHNLGKVRPTKSYRPWKLVHKKVFPDKFSARRRELEIKSYKSGEAFKKLIET